MLSIFPISMFHPFRVGAVKFPRGSLIRSACIAVLKSAKKTRKLSTLLDEVRPLDLPDISFGATDSMVLDDVYWFGVQGYEGKLSDLWIGLCARSENILEIGGNIGLYTVIGARNRRGNYTVVEPVPVNAEILRANLVRNKITGVKLLEAAAISDRMPKDVSLNIPSEGRGAPVGAHLVSSVVGQRTSEEMLTVMGIPMRDLVADCDLIKIDAEGIEAELLESVTDLLLQRKPTLVIEVLPEAERLGALVAELAEMVGYLINIIPAYGTDKIVSVPAGEFSSSVPRRFNSKDIVLSTFEL